MEFVPKFAINDAWILGILDELFRQALTLEFRDSGEQWENTMGLQSALSLKPKLFLTSLPIVFIRMHIKTAAAIGQCYES